MANGIANHQDENGAPNAHSEAVPISWLHLIFEAAIFVSAFAVAHFLRFSAGFFPDPTEFIPLAKYLYFAALITPVWILLHLGHGLYFQKIQAPFSEEFGALVNAQTQGFLALIVIGFFERDFPSSRITLLLILAATFLGCLILRISLKILRNYLFANGIGVRPLIVVGESTLGELLLKRIEINASLGFRLGERITIDGGETADAVRVLRHLLKDRVEIPAVLVAAPLADELLAAVILECHRAGVECILPSERSAAAGLPSSARMMEGVPVVKLATAGELAWLRLKKRAFDLAVVALTAILWLPLFLIVALMSLIFQGAPVFFTHLRLGRRGRVIPTYKFRTMVKDADRLPPPDEFTQSFKAKDDPRITRFGKILRKTSLDELPQIINIIRGDISLVGPRPIVAGELEKYGAWAGLLLSVPPGLTGLWQVSGRSDLSYAQRVELDAYYIHNWSLALDVRILLQTLPAVLKRRGAY